MEKEKEGYAAVSKRLVERMKVMIKATATTRRRERKTMFQHSTNAKVSSCANWKK